MAVDDYVYLRDLSGATVRRFEPTGRPLVIIQAKDTAGDDTVAKLSKGFETRAISGGGPCGFDLLFLPARLTYEVVGAQQAPLPAEVLEAPSSDLVGPLKPIPRRW